MCWSTSPAEADESRGLTRSSFGHGAHSNGRDLQCQGQKYALTSDRKKHSVGSRPVCHRNSVWGSSGRGSSGTAHRVPPASPAPASVGVAAFDPRSGQGGRRPPRCRPGVPRSADTLVTDPEVDVVHLCVPERLAHAATPPPDARSRQARDLREAVDARRRIGRRAGRTHSASPATVGAVPLVPRFQPNRHARSTARIAAGELGCAPSGARHVPPGLARLLGRHRLAIGSQLRVVGRVPSPTSARTGSTWSIRHRSNTSTGLSARRSRPDVRRSRGNEDTALVQFELDGRRHGLRRREPGGGGAQERPGRRVQRHRRSAPSTRKRRARSGSAAPAVHHPERRPPHARARRGAPRCRAAGPPAGLPRLRRPLRRRLLRGHRG